MKYTKFIAIFMALLLSLSLFSCSGCKKDGNVGDNGAASTPADGAESPTSPEEEKEPLPIDSIKAVMEIAGEYFGLSDMSYSRIYTVKTESADASREDKITSDIIINGLGTADEAVFVKTNDGKSDRQIVCIGGTAYIYTKNAELESKVKMGGKVEEYIPEVAALIDATLYKNISLGKKTDGVQLTLKGMKSEDFACFAIGLNKADFSSGAEFKTEILKYSFDPNEDISVIIKVNNDGKLESLTLKASYSHNGETVTVSDSYFVSYEAQSVKLPTDAADYVEG